jgi:C4-dicarboxylate-specific signal transduction histidine kinase
MGHLAAGLAHEVNQPLATISNYVEACDVELSRRPDDLQSQRLRKHLFLAKQAALRAGQIVHRMKCYVRPNDPAAIDVELNQLIRNVVMLIRREAEDADTELRLDLSNRSAIVTVDPIQIQQVIVNLVQNAIHAICSGAMEAKRIRICTTIVNESVQVDVIDSGPGFNTDDCEKVFTPFYTTKCDGLGIGLAICREIVESNSGAIWADTHSSGGATVSFTLPLSETNARSVDAQCDCVCN